MRSLQRWGVGVVAVAIAITLAKSLGLTLKWPDFWHIILFVPIFAVSNTILGGILRLLTLPFNLMTLGLLGFVINAIVFWIAGALTGAEMNFVSALFGSVAVTVISAPLNWTLERKRSER